MSKIDIKSLYLSELEELMVSLKEPKLERGRFSSGYSRVCQILMK